MKIPSSQENPFDIINIWLADKLCPVFKVLNMTPNHITTLSLIFAIIAIIALANYKFTPFAICFYISYIFDCMDGHYARKYGLVTKFGDYYDHIKDISVIIAMILVILYRYKLNTKTTVIFLVYILLTAYLLSFHMGCQERLYQNEESPSLSKLKMLCFGNPEKTIQFTKWFGAGTWVILFIGSIFYIIRNRQK